MGMGSWIIITIILFAVFSKKQAGGSENIDPKNNNKKDEIDDNLLNQNQSNIKICKGIKIMEKLDAILIEDESGTHYVPFSNIQSVSEVIGSYDRYRRAYMEKYSKPRYVIRLNSDSFYVNKTAYKALIERLYNVVLKTKRDIGDY